MIIKEADGREQALGELRALMGERGLDAFTKKRIEQEIKNIQAGARAESEVAYDLKAHLEKRSFWGVIHDVRLEHEGVVAQIDHMLINRYLEVLVCESKHFSEGVAINEQGEFTAFFASKPYGVPSPIEQNRRHIAVLERVVKSGALRLPTRLGLTIRPSFQSLVLVSQRARITRPKKAIEGLDAVIKNDQLMQYLDKKAEDGGMAQLAKVVSGETLRELCEQIAALHRPIQINWRAKFGLPAAPGQSVAPAAPSEKTAPKLVAVAPSQGPMAGSSWGSISALTQPGAPELSLVPSAAKAPLASPSANPQVAQGAAVGAGRKEQAPAAPGSGEALSQSQAQAHLPGQDSGAPGGGAKQKLICAACDEAVPYAVAKFCWMNKGKFGGRILCRACQAKA